MTKKETPAAQPRRSAVFVRNILRAILGVFLLAGLAILISRSFKGLLTPPDEPNTVGLAAITNNYDTRVPLGTIRDRSGVPLIATVASDKYDEPILDENGLYQFFLDLDEDTQRHTLRSRLIVADGKGSAAKNRLTPQEQAAWSNILPAWPDGADYAFDAQLKNITIEREQSADVSLTLDRAVQYDAWKILQGGGRKCASAVIMDLDCGDLLAMTSTPSYDHNALLKGTLPFSRSSCNSETLSGYTINNAYDCVQDYYKAWYARVRLDNRTIRFSGWSEFDGQNYRSWIQSLKNEHLLVNRAELDQELTVWERAGWTAQNFSFTPQTALTVDFRQMREAQIAANPDDPDALFQKTAFPYEPEGLGSGTEYIPFVRVLLHDGTNTEWYLRLCYGSNNFILSDCRQFGFDPNFSLTNYNTQTAPPGSSFKILTASLLADQVPEQLIYDSDIHISNVYFDKTTQDTTFVNSAGERVEMNTWIIPTVETSKRNHYTLRQALQNSSNQFFSFAGMQLNRILSAPARSVNLTIQSLQELTEEDCRASGTIMKDFLEQKYCISDTEKLIQTKFSLSRSTVHANLDNAQLSRRDYQKALGDTAYGMGQDAMTPIFMAMAIGKATTGKMVMPNLLLSDSGEPQYLGSEFDRGDQTVAIMHDHLQSVFSEYISPNHYGSRDYKFDGCTGLTYTAKTGTSSVTVTHGTQGRYGLFAELNKNFYSEEKGAYQIIWFVGTVSDGQHNYAIVLRSFFDQNNSGSLLNEFRRIAESLCQHGYLKPAANT